MARPRKKKSAEEEVKKAEELVIKKKAELDAAVNVLKIAREKAEKERQELLIAAAMKSKWSYDEIMAFIQSDPTDTEE